MILEIRSDSEKLRWSEMLWVDDCICYQLALAGMASCQALRRARLKDLRVAEQHVEASAWAAFSPAEPPSLRVMQYNILADAMSDDGFLVRPVLANWPVPEKFVPTADGGQVEFHTLLSEMMEAKGNPAALEECQKKYTCTASAENTNAVRDWEARKLQIMCLIESFSPDIIVLAELDHYDEFLSGLRELGYESQLEQCKQDIDFFIRVEQFCDCIPWR